MFIKLIKNNKVIADFSVANVNEANFQKNKYGADSWQEYKYYTIVNENTGFILKEKVKFDLGQEIPFNYIDTYEYPNPVGKWSFKLLRWVDYPELSNYQHIDTELLWEYEVRLCSEETTSFDILTDKPIFLPAKWDKKNKVWIPVEPEK